MSKKRTKWILPALAVVLGLGLLAFSPRESTDGIYLGATALAAEVELGNEAVALAGAPAIHDSLTPTAPGTLVAKNQKAIVDYSNTSDGYVMVKFTAASDKRLAVKVVGPQTADGYLYYLTQGEWTTFPLSDGNGSYTVTVFEHVEAGKYAVVLSANFSVQLSDEFAPFIRPNQYVNYAGADKTVAKAAELTKDISEPLAKVEKVYEFVVGNLTYDVDRASSVQSGYLPVLDSVLEEKKGICFDYAALMTGMLRSQGVPCQLVVGYAGEVYHAWVNVWIEGQGWVTGVIYFDGQGWQRMDPTFASSGKGSEAIMKYIGDGSNYSAKYLY